MPKEYIERNDLIKNLNEFAPEHYSALINNLIVKQPTVDVVEVRHGHWIQGLDGSYMCSECSKVSRYEIGHYCSNCGAKMDGKDGAE